MNASASEVLEFRFTTPSRGFGSKFPAVNTDIEKPLWRKSRVSHVHGSTIQESPAPPISWKPTLRLPDAATMGSLDHNFHT